MYLPPYFREDRPEVLAELMRDFPLAALVSHGEQGLIANHLPLLYDSSEAPYGVLRGHMARANGHWKELNSAPDALAIFQGPESYISPSLLATKRETGKVVPTWNYAVVHAWGPVTVFDEPDRLREFVSNLTRVHEGKRENPWAVTDAPEDYIRDLLTRIVGIELKISRIEGKWKVSQNQPARNAESVATAIGEPMADLIRSRKSGT